MVEEFKITVPYMLDLSMRYLGQDGSNSMDLQFEKEDLNKSIEHYVRTEKVIREG